MAAFLEQPAVSTVAPRHAHTQKNATGLAGATKNPATRSRPFITTSHEDRPSSRFAFQFAPESARNWLLGVSVSAVSRCSRQQVASRYSLTKLARLVRRALTIRFTSRIKPSSIEIVTFRFMLL